MCSFSFIDMLAFYVYQLFRDYYHARMVCFFLYQFQNGAHMIYDSHALRRLQCLLLLETLDLSRNSVTVLDTSCFQGSHRWSFPLSKFLTVLLFIYIIIVIVLIIIFVFITIFVLLYEKNETWCRGNNKRMFFNSYEVI